MSLIEQGTPQYEHDLVNLIVYLSKIYQGTRCKLIPAEHNKAPLSPTNTGSYIN